MLLISRGTEPFKLPYRRSGFRDHLESSHVPEFFTRTMTPSKCASDQFILELLAQNLARQGGERKRKKEVDGKNMAIIEPSLKKNKAQLETVTDEYQKRSPKEKDVKTEANISAEVDHIAQCVVYHHLKDVTPKLAEEFAASRKFLQSSVKLKDVVEVYFKKFSPDIDNVKKKSHKLVKHKTNSKVGWTRTKYSTEEDEVIRKAVNKAEAGGEDINYLALGTQLNRKWAQCTAGLDY